MRIAAAVAASLAIGVLCCGGGEAGPSSPDQDVEGGRDIPGIDRYPGAVIAESAQYGRVRHVRYHLVGPRALVEAAAFYQTTLTEAGWTAGPEMPIAEHDQTATLYFRNGTLRATVIVMSMPLWESPSHSTYISISVIEAGP